MTGAPSRRISLVASVLLASACADTDVAPAEPATGPAGTFVLDFDGAPDAAGTGPIVAARGDGSRFVVAASGQPSALLVFDREGRFLEAFAQQGMGPGELGSVSALAFDPADSLWVFGSGRVDVFGPDLAFARSMPLTVAPMDVATRPDGSGVLVAGAPDGDDLRVWVRLLSPGGELVPLEREAETYAPRGIGARYRAVTPSSQGYWVANFYEWDIRHLTEAGDTLLRIADAPDWWQPFDDPEMAGFIDTSPAILDIVLDEHGRLLVLAGVPIPDRAALEALQQGDSSPAVTSRFADHVVRAYDAATGALLGERRFDYLPLRFLNGGLAAAAIPRGDSIEVEIHGLAGLP